MASLGATNILRSVTSFDLEGVIDLDNIRESQCVDVESGQVTSSSFPIARFGDPRIEETQPLFGPIRMPSEASATASATAPATTPDAAAGAAASASAEEPSQDC